jgi:hypothetical protein
MINEAPSVSSQVDEEKTVSLKEVDAEKTETIYPSAQSSEKKATEEIKKPVKTLNKTRVLKRKRNTITSTKWEETCYVCNEYGDLICCDGCPNVAHLFCVCLEVNFYLSRLSQINGSVSFARKRKTNLKRKINDTYLIVNKI